MKHSFKDWVTATRYWSFPVSTMPVVACFAYLFSKGLVPAGPKPYIMLALSLLGVMVLHAAGNLISDWSDYRKGVDNEEAYAVPNLVFKHFQPEEYLRFSIILFIVGIALGIAITLLSGIGVLVVGVTAVVLTLLYSFLKYHALGDLDIFIIFGILTILGTTCAITGNFVPEALVLSLPIGVITVSVLHANNTVDIRSDGAAGIKTFAMLIGAKASSVLYRAYMVIPFICIIASVIAGWLHPLSLLSLAAAIPAYRNFKKAGLYDKEGIDALKGLDQATAQMQLVFSGLLSIGLLIAGVIG